MSQKSLNNTKTEANIKTAFANECMAWAKYTYYGAKAKTEGYEQIAKLFAETATNESAHAEIWYKQLNDGIATTDVNLGKSAENENYEWSEMYKEFEQTAREEGFDNIARLFKEVGEIEKSHLDRYNQLIKDVENNEVFNKQTEVNWKCTNCGHIHRGMSAPDVCPVCAHPKAYFEVNNENC